MLYAHDGTGIGHVVRTCTLAGAIRSLYPNAVVSVATGSPVVQRYLPAGVRLHQLPPQVRVDANVPQMVIKTQRAERKRLTLERRQMLLEYVQDWLPDVLLVDHLPLGKREELNRAVQFLHTAGRTAFLGYRRILEDHHSTEQIFNYGPFRSALVSFFKAIIVYAPTWVEETHGPLTNTPLPQIHVGFVCRREASSKQAARRHFGLNAGHNVVACCLGGGRDTWPMARAILESWRHLNPAHTVLLFFVGPHQSPPDHELQSYAVEPNISIIRDSPHFPRGIAAADAVLTTGGYNSMLEALVLGRPLWAIPNQRFECEQENSVAYFEQLGLVNRIRLDESLETVLRKTFRDILGALSTKQSTLPVQAAWFRGAENTARLLRRCAENPNCKLPFEGPT
jgi:predicted glycosyltransferase